ncbi:MAG: ATP-binding cassette domain-containing protein [Chloroflexi bacterium]|jgi:ABC-2 type transport system ATP-binding protein|nr:ATP-binding cassette domain-containing protein [Chloroflexota bacterium]
MKTVSVSSVSKRFGSVQAVSDVSFEVFPGEIFGLLGPNGAGKTTTIRMMLDIFEPDSGEIEILGGRLDEEKKKRIGYMPEERGLYKDQKLEPTLVFLASLKGMSSAQAHRDLEDWLKRLDLWEHRSKEIKELSKGMQQKAQLIATLVHDPDLIVVDEPFSGLDPVNTRLVKDILEEQRRAGKTILMSTHQMNQVEALCNRIVLINQGRSVLYGEVSEIKRRFAGNALTLQGQGEIPPLPGVLDMRHQNGAWQLTLDENSDPQEILRQVAGLDSFQVERFELTQPSLDDIFVTVVQEGRLSAEVANA